MTHAWGRGLRWLLAVGVMSGLLAACGGNGEAEPTATTAPVATATTAAAATTTDLSAMKGYSLDRAAEMKTATAALAEDAASFYADAEAADFDYQAMFDADPEGIAALLAKTKQDWIAASTAYEQNEGIIAGVPSLSYYDVWIDAGPSGEEDATGALDWQLELPNGETLDKPGNFFHNLTEPAIWGTDDDFVGLRADLDQDGTQELGEVMPEANIFKAATEGLDAATAEMTGAINDWEPTPEDAFTALVVMIPTMNEYFEQWKLSVFVAGAQETEEVAFVALSRLFDINGILAGLDLTYDQLSTNVTTADSGLDAQIQEGFETLIGHVGDLYQQEADGKHFTADEADVFGSEAQDQATQLAGQVSQAAALLGVAVAE
ncbi:MAG TPA: imelysin family protein [Thermomicrobiales bacterium]|nr:imelysin family protein [Thermomicrobiales bacterium]